MRATLPFSGVNPYNIGHGGAVPEEMFYGRVEERQAVGVFRKVSGHPIDNNADACLVAAIDELHEIVMGTVARGWGEITGDLIAPGLSLIHI